MPGWVAVSWSWRIPRLQWILTDTIWPHLRLPLSLPSEFTVPASCKWHFIQLEMWILSGALAPSSLSEIHYQVGIRLSCCSCAAWAQRIMNNENSMGWRQTQLADRLQCQPFTLLNVTHAAQEVFPLHSPGPVMSWMCGEEEGLSSADPFLFHILGIPLSRPVALFHISITSKKPRKIA